MPLYLVEVKIRKRRGKDKLDITVHIERSHKSMEKQHIEGVSKREAVIWESRKTVNTDEVGVWTDK